MQQSVDGQAKNRKGKKTMYMDIEKLKFPGSAT